MTAAIGVTVGDGLHTALWSQPGLTGAPSFSQSVSSPARSIFPHALLCRIQRMPSPIL